MEIQQFFDKETATFTYVVSDPVTAKCAIIDAVLSFDLYSGKTSTASADKIIAYVEAKRVSVEWILETHAHADHLTAAHYLQQSLGGKIGIGERILDVLKFWVPLFNIAVDTPLDGSQFDHLFKDGEIFNIGKLTVKVIATPGHTPACVSYLVEDAAFVGDTLFMPYIGTARADFPGGGAETLYDSIQKLLALPSASRLFTGHDYPGEDKSPYCVATVEEQKKSNVMIHEGVDKVTYVERRQKRDQQLPLPRLILPSLQINLRAGKLGERDNYGRHYIKIPIDAL